MKTKHLVSGIIILLFCSGNFAASFAPQESLGKVVDARTGTPIHNALLTLDKTTVSTDSSGKFQLPLTDQPILVRASGYRRQVVQSSRQLEISLEPLLVQAIYVNFWAAGSSQYRQKLWNIIESSEINAVVIDVKNEYGYLSYLSDIPLAETIKAYKKRTIRDLDALIQKFKNNQIYTIARLPVFQDNLLATSLPETAVKNKNGEVWQDNLGLAWTDPFNHKVRQYNIDIAIEAAKRGFDEINFDYARFPEKQGLKYRLNNNQNNRLKAISEFLQQARIALVSYNVFLSIDTYGYVCWNSNDTGIGHRLKELAEQVDYIAPMLYPSAFQFGIPDYTNPVENPYEIVHRSLKNAIKLSNISPLRFRPWLQTFRDYGFDQRVFGVAEIAKQIKGAENAGTSGWMLWHSASRYNLDGLNEATKTIESE